MSRSYHWKHRLSRNDEEHGGAGQEESDSMMMLKKLPRNVQKKEGMGTRISVEVSYLTFSLELSYSLKLSKAKKSKKKFLEAGCKF